MSRVTALRLGRGRGKRVNIYLDGAFAFSLGVEVVAQEGLKVGQELTRSQLEELGVVDGSQRCLEAAVHYLSYRPRSEFELRERLVRRGFDSDSIEAAMARLKEQGLVDDVDFARFWRDNRQSFSPRSRWLTGLELRRKGVAEEVIDRVVGDVDDEASAYRAALSRAHRLTASDYQSFRHCLAEYLRRRGFGYRVINNTVEQLWQEIRDQH
ncbi:MAG: RecX family transcriptional regulator [Dehalococcoidales bacterium]|nr:RecX family transcriptional regulator [Dehalococcoidales bacterium]